MVFDIRWNVFVMWKRTCQRRVVGMGLCVVPGKFLHATPQLVAIELDLDRIAVQG